MTTTKASAQDITDSIKEQSLTKASDKLLEVHKQLKEARTEHEGKELVEMVQLDTLSPLSVDVCNTFGPDSYGLMNLYACSMEDMLKEMAQVHKKLIAEVARNHKLVDDLRSQSFQIREDFATVKDCVASSDWEKLKDIIRALGV